MTFNVKGTLHLFNCRRVHNKKPPRRGLGASRRPGLISGVTRYLNFKERLTERSRRGLYFKEREYE